MNKKVIGISAGIVSVLALGAGGTAYYVQSELESRQELLNSNIEKIAKVLPPQIKLQKGDIDSGIFSTDGSYTLSYVEPKQKELNGNVVINYHLDHGFDSWFGGDIPFTATTKIEGNITKTLSIKTAGDVASNIAGLIKEDGSFSFEQKSDSFSMVIPAPTHEEEKADNINEKNPVDAASTPAVAVEKPNKESAISVSLKNVIGKVNFNAQSGDFKNDYQYGEMVLQNSNSEDKITFKNISGNASGSLSKPDTQFTFKVANISNSNEKAKFNLEGLDALVSLTSKNGKQDIKFNTKVKKLDVLEQKDIELEVGYSVLGLDEKVTKLYKKFVNTYSAGKEFTEKDFTDARSDVVSALKSGIVVSLDSLKFKNPNNTINFNAKFELAPTEKDKSFAFSTQTKFNVNLTAEGESTQLGAELLSSYANIDPTVKQINLNVNYENGALKVNNEMAKEETNQLINETLKSIDLKWGFITEDKPAITEPAPAPIDDKTSIVPEKSDK